MHQGSIYLTVDDLQKLMGGSKRSAYSLHLTIRAAITVDDGRHPPGWVKPNLLISEYCEYMQEDVEVVMEAIRPGYN